MTASSIIIGTRLIIIGVMSDMTTGMIIATSVMLGAKTTGMIAIIAVTTDAMIAETAAMTGVMITATGAMIGGMIAEIVATTEGMTGATGEMIAGMTGARVVATKAARPRLPQRAGPDKRKAEGEPFCLLSLTLNDRATLR